MIQIGLLFYCIIMLNAEIIIVSDNNVTTCVANILKENVILDLLIIYSSPLPKDIFLKDILNLEIKKIVFNNNYFAINKTLLIFSSYLLIVESVEVVQDFLTILITNTLFNPEEKIIILYTGNNTEEFDEMFRICWKYYILNVVLIHHNGFIYTYYPYKNNQCGNIIQSELLGFCTQSISDVFREKVPLVAKNCTLRLVAMKIAPYVINMTDARNPGVEVMIVREMAQKLNLTIKNITHNFHGYGEKISDENYTKIFQMIYTREADLMIGMVRINATDFKDFHSTVPHLFDQATWHVATASEISKWKNMYRIFEVKIWILLSIILIINCFIWWIFGQNPMEVQTFHNIENCFIIGLGVLLSWSVAIPKGKILRFLFILWSFFSILVVTAYQSKLISILMKTVYEEQIKKSSEILGMGMKFGYNEAIRNIFNDTSHKNNYRYYMEFVPCPVAALECIERAAYKKDFAVFKNRRQIRYLTRRFLHPNGRPMLYSFKKDIMYYSLRMVVRKGYPFYHKMNHLIGRMHTAGLINKWDADVAPPYKYIEHSVQQPLTIEHLAGAFIILFIGLICALLVFICEIFLH